MLTEIEDAVRCELVLVNASKKEVLELGDLADHGNGGLVVIGSHQTSPFTDKTHLDYALEYNYQKKHIHLTSNEQIQINDFYVEKTALGVLVHQMNELAFKDWHSTPEKLEIHCYRCRKIIASTNSKMVEQGVGAISGNFVSYYTTKPVGLISIVDYFFDEEYSGSDPVPFMRPYVRPVFPTVEDAAHEYLYGGVGNMYTSFIEGAKWFAKNGNQSNTGNAY